MAINVSVVIITKNEEENIAACLKSLCEQEYDMGNYEIIVCDSSTDKTPDIAKQFTASVFTVEKRGFGAARNFGIAKAKYSIVAFTDADCVAPKTWLKALASAKNGFAGAGGSAFPPENADYFGKCIACLGYPAGGALGADVASGIISTCNAIFDKSAILSAGGFDEALKWGGEDTALSKKLASSGHKIKIEKNIFVWHKARTLNEFLNWCFKRGMAKYYLEKNPAQLAMPLAALAYPFTQKFRTLIRQRKSIGIGLPSALVTVTLLFFIRQVMLSFGWIAAFLKFENGNTEIIAD